MHMWKGTPNAYIMLVYLINGLVWNGQDEWCKTT